jgi:two-component system OmpR family response regulator
MGTTAPPRILLVDDEVQMLEIYGELLERIGAKVRAESDARVAASAIEQDGPFDLVVLDLRMPFVDGYELLRRIRSGPAKDLPVLVVTGYPTQGSAEECRRLGVREYLRKPFDPDELIRHIRRALKRPGQTTPGGSATSPNPRSEE